MNTKTKWIIALAVIGASVAGASITLEFPVASTNTGALADFKRRHYLQLFC